MATIPKLTLYKSVIFGILIVIIGTAVQFLSTSTQIDSKIGLDTLFKLRGTVAPPDETVIVAIDKLASSHYGFSNEPLAWSRDYHAKIIQKLQQAGAKLIIFDIFFKRQRNEKHDQFFAEEIKKAGNVILFAKLNRELLDTEGKTPETLNIDNILSLETIQQPLDQFSQAALTTAPFTLPKFPTKVTRFWTFRATAGDTPTIPIIALHYYHQQEFKPLIESIIKNENNPSINSIVRQVRENILQDKSQTKQLIANIAATKNLALNNLLAAYSGPSQPYLNFYGPPRTITTFTYNQVLENKIPKSYSFKDKIVFVGFSEKLEPEQKDNFNTVFSQENGLDLSGIEISATAFSNLLHNTTIKPVSTQTAFLIIIVFGFVVGFVCRAFREYLALGLCISLSALYLHIALNQFSSYATWLPLFVPILIQAPLALVLGLSWNMLDSYRARKEMRHAFSYYVPEKMVDLLTEQKQPIEHSQQLQYGVCMATDAEQYTQLAETLSPEDLAELMNQYYENLFSAVRKNKGTVSDIIGDAMLALWLPTVNNNKDDQSSHIEVCIQACLTALEIIKTHGIVYSIANKQITLPTRIGLHAGEMMIGNVGAVDHYEYRAVGDIVNTTNRIEGLNKRFGTYLLASQSVVQETDQFLARNIGNFLLAGKHQAITLYEIIKLKAHATVIEENNVDEFHQALALFQQGLLQQAEVAFTNLCKTIPTDNVVHFYLQQCKQQSTISEDSVSDDWDGTIKITNK